MDAAGAVPERRNRPDAACPAAVGEQGRSTIAVPQERRRSCRLRCRLCKLVNWGTDNYFLLPIVGDCPRFFIQVTVPLFFHRGGQSPMALLNDCVSCNNLSQ